MAFDLGTIWAEIGVSTQKLDSGLMQAQVKLASADKSISTMGQKLTAQSTKLMTTGGIMAGAVIAVGVASVKMASQFETSMRNVNSISKLSEDQFRAMSADVVNLSKTLPQSAKVLADGLYDISSSGFQGADGMKVLEAAAKAASAGLTTTAVSAKGITAVLNAYGLEAEDAAGISDTMFRTVDRGVITFEELSSTVGDWVGMAKAANISFNEASGAIAYMTTKGISAAEAGVSLTRILTSIIKPSEDMATFIKAAGYESGEMMLKTLGLTGTMKLLNDTTGGSITKLTDLIPEIRGVRGANALLGAGYEELNTYMQGFNDTAGSTGIALEEQSKSLSFQLDILKNNATALGIDLGNKLIPPIANVVKKLNDLDPATKDNIENMIILALKSTTAVSALTLLAGAIGKVRAVAMLLNSTTMVTSAGGFLGLVAGTTAAAGFAGALIAIANGLSNVTNGFYEAAKGKITFDEAMGILKEQSVFFAPEGKQSQLNAYNQIMKDIGQTTGNVTISTAGWSIAMNEANKKLTENDSATVEAIAVEKDNEATLQRLQQQYGYTAEQALIYAQDNGLLKTAIDETTESTDQQIQSIDDLIASLYKLYNLNQSVTEATWNYEDSLKNLNDVISNANSTEREKQEAIFGTQDALENLQIAMAKELSDTETSIERKKELQDQYIKTGLEAVSTGAMSESAFAKMAATFGLKSADIIKFADDMGIKLDIVTRKRIIEADINFEKVRVGSAELDGILNNLTRRRTIDIDINYNQRILSIPGAPAYPGRAMGGVVGYSGGGIINMPKIPAAASGMVIPQTGREIPIIAHENEIVANSSQQRNLAEWIMNKANTRPDSKGGSGGNIFNIYPQTSMDFEDPTNIRLMEQAVARALNK